MERMERTTKARRGSRCRLYHHGRSGGKGVGRGNKSRNGARAVISTEMQSSGEATWRQGRCTLSKGPVDQRLAHAPWRCAGVAEQWIRSLSVLCSLSAHSRPPLPSIVESSLARTTQPRNAVATQAGRILSSKGFSSSSWPAGPSVRLSTLATAPVPAFCKACAPAACRRRCPCIFTSPHLLGVGGPRACSRLTLASSELMEIGGSPGKLTLWNGRPHRRKGGRGRCAQPVPFRALRRGRL
ncbi:hypothetical protein VTI74DRAFT_2280 [Chaetomium olivicolor]